MMIYKYFDKQPVSQLYIISKCKQKLMAGNTKLSALFLQFCSDAIVKLERCIFHRMHYIFTILRGKLKSHCCNGFCTFLSVLSENNIVNIN